MANKKVKLVDIAKKLDVSTGLVSLVLSNKWQANRVSENLAKKVIATANEMGYKKNQLATSLRTGKSNIIGLVVADIGNLYFGKMARYIEDEASKYGYQVMFGSSHENAQKLKNIINTFLSRQVDGLLVVPVKDSGTIFNEIEMNGTSLVFIDRYSRTIEEDAVLTDNFEGAYQLCRVLINKGYKKIAAFVYDNRLTNNEDRIKGYKSALKNTDLEGIDGKFIYEVSFSHNTKAHLKHALEHAIKNGCDAIFFANNHLGTLSLKYLQEMNIRIPKDIGVVSFDNPKVFQIIQPGITCFKQPIKEICKRSVEILIKKINNKNLTEKHKILLPGKIIERNSC